MKLRVAITPSSFADNDATPLRLLEEAGVEVVPNPYKRRLTEDEAIEILKDVDGVLAGVEPLTKRVFESSPRLKAIARVGVGMSNVDVKAAEERGIKVSNTPEGPTQAVAELTVAVMLAMTRQFLPLSDALHAGRWEKKITRGLEGLVVAFIGYGRIGRRVREMLRPFNIQAIIVDPFLPDANSLGSDRTLPLNEALPLADIVTLHAAGSNVILGSAEIQLMKPGALVLNPARGGLVDEPALVEALQDGRIGGAWFDTYVREPYTGPLQGMKNVILTPHIATYTVQCRSNMEGNAVKNLLRDLGLGGD